MLGGSMAGVLGGAGRAGGIKNVRNFCEGVVVAQLVSRAAAVRIHTRPDMAPAARMPITGEFSRFPPAGVNYPPRGGGPSRGVFSVSRAGSRHGSDLLDKQIPKLHPRPRMVILKSNVSLEWPPLGSR